MQAGYIDHLAPREAEGAEPPAHITRLRSLLLDAEVELRKRRQHRLELESSKFLSGERSADVANVQLPYDPPEDLAMKAMAAHHEPPPAVLHRLAVAVMLLLEAPLLVDLGEHPLPWRVPWRNLQVLLRKPCEATSAGTSTATAAYAPMASIVAALRRQPFGERLAKHVQRILVGDTPVTREEIVETDTLCGCLYDWVQNLITPLLTRSESPGMKADASPQDEAVSQDHRDRIVAAVSDQEKEVARLRRKLREAERSEQAAAQFVSENEPAAAKLMDSTETTQSELDENLEVTGHKSLQYRLEEVNVPAMQEAVLHSLVKTLLEPRAGQRRRLEIIGHAEDREVSETAKERAEAAEAWLLSYGVPAERLSVQWEAGGSAICRRTDLRVLEPAGAESAMRQKAAELMKRIFAARSEADDPGSSQQPESTPIEEPSESHDTAQPSVTLEETMDSAAQCRQLRLVFQKDSLTPTDAVLEIGSRTVRLGSASGAWKDLEVALPFDVISPDQPAAKFSRKAGTLTVLLTAALR
mmetsp:Transcript_4491/g.10484  ORF Transcript_4491/g.10484 Transcript_4491/m.10484 type:complete len:528 (+) Transcript_4491:66-1649(+)|eukprot:s3700_g12.t2